MSTNETFSVSSVNSKKRSANTVKCEVQEGSDTYVDIATNVVLSSNANGKYYCKFENITKSHQGGRNLQSQPGSFENVDKTAGDATILNSSLKIDSLVNEDSIEKMDTETNFDISQAKKHEGQYYKKNPEVAEHNFEVYDLKVDHDGANTSSRKFKKKETSSESSSVAVESERRKTNGKSQESFRLIITKTVIDDFNKLYSSNNANSTNTGKGKESKIFKHKAFLERGDKNEDLLFFKSKSHRKRSYSSDSEFLGFPEDCNVADNLFDNQNKRLKLDSTENNDVSNNDGDDAYNDDDDEDHENNANMNNNESAGYEKHNYKSSVNSSNEDNSTMLPNMKRGQPKIQFAQDSIYKLPFECGWKRELVYRAKASARKDKGEVYYITPTGKKLRTRSDIIKNLTDGLSLDNFTFAKEPVGVGPDKELIRSAKPSNRNQPASVTTIGKRIPKPKVPKGASPPPIGGTLLMQVPSARLQFNKDAKLSKTFNKSKSMGTNIISSDNDQTRKSNNRNTKFLNTKTAGEPCTMQCPLAMGMIPHLQCVKCLCLYHHECVGMSRSISDDSSVWSNIKNSNGVNGTLEGRPKMHKDVNVNSGSSDVIEDCYNCINEVGGNGDLRSYIDGCEKIIGYRKNSSFSGEGYICSSCEYKITSKALTSPVIGIKLTGINSKKPKATTLSRLSKQSSTFVSLQIIPNMPINIDDDNDYDDDKNNAEHNDYIDDLDDDDYNDDYEEGEECIGYNEDDIHGHTPLTISTLETNELTLRRLSSKSIPSSTIKSSKFRKYDSSVSPDLDKNQKNKILSTHKHHTYISNSLYDTPKSRRYDNEHKAAINQINMPNAKIIQYDYNDIENKNVKSKDLRNITSLQAPVVATRKITTTTNTTKISHKKQTNSSCNNILNNENINYSLQNNVSSNSISICNSRGNIAINTNNNNKNYSNEKNNRSYYNTNNSNDYSHNKNSDSNQSNNTNIGNNNNDDIISDNGNTNNRGDITISSQYYGGQLPQTIAVIQGRKYVVLWDRISISCVNSNPKLGINATEESNEQYQKILATPAGKYENNNYSKRKGVLTQKRLSENMDKSTVTKTQKKNSTSQPLSILSTGPITKSSSDNPAHFLGNLSVGYNVLLHTFKYLKVQELLRASCVSRMWNAVANNRTLWKTIRMKNSQVKDWGGFASTLRRNDTRRLDLRKILIWSKNGNEMWVNFLKHIGTVSTLEVIDFCRCRSEVVEHMFLSNPNIKILNATAIRDEKLCLQDVCMLSSLQELRLKTIDGGSIEGNLLGLSSCTNLRHLSLISFRGLFTTGILVIGQLVNLESLELGECDDLQENFANILPNLIKLKRLRLEKGERRCDTLAVLDRIANMGSLLQLELINFDVKKDFDVKLALCKHLKRLLIIPTYLSQSATTNNIVLNAVLNMPKTLHNIVWAVTMELLRVTALYVDQCDKKRDRSFFNESIPILKPVPGIVSKAIRTIEDVPQVEILPLRRVEKIMANALPSTEIKILKIPYHSTWRQTLTTGSWNPLTENLSKLN